MINTIGLNVTGGEAGLGAAIIAAIGAVFAGLKKGLSFILKYKKTAMSAMNLLSQSMELVETFDKALEDKKITKEELKDLRKEASDVKNAYIELKDSLKK